MRLVDVKQLITKKSRAEQSEDETDQSSRICFTPDYQSAHLNKVLSVRQEGHVTLISMRTVNTCRMALLQLTSQRAYQY